MEFYTHRYKSPINSILSPKRLTQLSSTIKSFTKKFNNITITDNHDIIKCLKSQDFNNDTIINDYKFFNDDFDNIIKQLTPTKIKYLSGIFARTTFDDLYCKLMPYSISILKEEQKKRTETKQDINIDFDKPFIDLFNQIYNDFNIHELIIISLYHNNPPKRLYDYIFCKISNEIPTKDFSKDFNYYYDGKIFINKCKIDTRTQSQKENNEFITINNIDIHTQNLIKKCFEIDNNNLNKNFLLMKEYKENIPVRFDNIMMKLYGIPIKVSQYRRLFLSYHDKKGMDKNKRIHFSNFMNHSLNEQNKYIYND